MDDSSIPPKASERSQAASRRPVRELDWQVLDAYLSGRATPDQHVQVRAWAGESEIHQRFIDVLRDPMTHDVMHADVEKRWEEFRRHVPPVVERHDRAMAHASERVSQGSLQGTPQQVGLPSVARDTRRGFSAPIQRRWVWLGGVAALIIGMIILTRRRPETRTDVTRTYATSAQQQAVINLADGTRVTLAPRTILKLQHFGTQSRTVDLEGGEAYFEVVHTSGVPFVVRSGVTTTQVLGTAFLIRHNAGDARVRVMVTDGKVRLVTSERSNVGLTLTARQVGNVTDSTIQKGIADDLAPGAEWESGDIVFRNTSVQTVLRTLTQWYGYQFRYADQALGTQKVTVMVSTRSSAEALAALERVLTVNLTVVGDTITLVPHSPRSTRQAPRIRTYDVWTPTREVGR